MAKIRAFSGKKKNSMLRLKIVVEKLQKGLLLGKKMPRPDNNFLDIEHDINTANDQVPEDVKEGHLAVVASYHYQLKRFIIPIGFLTHPSFLTLLEQAAEEYGFDHEGALMVPCHPSKLEKILEEQCMH
ncbi:auxin-responsive protein SAUR15-like [Impatiens glandulifera]|uniref:auxin-responsive protein SAUR15-like n=1 Tax=Impatiens glandulifera TaxID=253017 RepID=UPI001FB0DFE3|nr:auxin-responsive protein SAUR15-like [Impatiens glandulifera]